MIASWFDGIVVGWGMDVQSLLRLDADLRDFVEDMFVSLRRKGWQERCSCYLTGLMLDGQRKSVQPMAVRLDEPNDQSLQHLAHVDGAARHRHPHHRGLQRTRPATEATLRRARQFGQGPHHGAGTETGHPGHPGSLRSRWAWP